MTATSWGQQQRSFGLFKSSQYQFSYLSIDYTFTIWPMFYFVPWNALLLILATSSLQNETEWYNKLDCKNSPTNSVFPLKFLVIFSYTYSPWFKTNIFQEKRYAAKYHSHFLNFYRRMVHIVMYNCWSNRKYCENWIFLLLITTCRTIKAATNRKFVR